MIDSARRLAIAASTVARMALVLAGGAGSRGMRHGRRSSPSMGASCRMTAMILPRDGHSSSPSVFFALPRLNDLPPAAPPPPA